MRTEAGETLSILNNDRADAGIGEQLFQLRTLVIEARSNLNDLFRHLIAFSGGVVLETTSLAFQVFLLSKRRHAPIQGNAARDRLLIVLVTHNEKACWRLIGV